MPRQRKRAREERSSSPPPGIPLSSLFNDLWRVSGPDDRPWYMYDHVDPAPKFRKASGSKGVMEIRRAQKRIKVEDQPYGDEDSDGELTDDPEGGKLVDDCEYE